MMGGIEEKEAVKIAVDFLKRRKNTDKIDVSIIEKKENSGLLEAHVQ